MSEYKTKGCNIPFYNLSKEVTKLMKDTLEEDEAGRMLFALYDFIYEGIEPSFETKVMRGIWNAVISTVERKAETYFKQAAANRENGKKGGRARKNNQDIPINNEFDTTPKIGANETPNQAKQANPQPIQESVSKGEEMGKNDRMNHQQLTDHLANLTETWDKTRRQVS